MAQILIIDDSASMLEFLDVTLTCAGHDIIAARHGGEAIGKMRDRDFDLVITDLYMPECDGIELINRIRDAGRLPRVIAISSGDVVIDLLQVAHFLGAMQTLHKPFSAAQLLEAVKDVLSLPIPVGFSLQQRTAVRARRTA